MIQFPQQCSPLRASVPPVCKAARTVFNKCKYRCWSRNRNLNHIERVHFWNDLSTFERQSLVFQPGLCSRACIAYWAVIYIAHSILALESFALRLYCWDVESMMSFTVRSSQSPLPCPHYLQSLHAQKLNPPPTIITNNDSMSQMPLCRYVYVYGYPLDTFELFDSFHARTVLIG